MNHNNLNVRPKHGKEVKKNEDNWTKTNQCGNCKNHPQLSRSQSLDPTNDIAIHVWSTKIIFGENTNNEHKMNHYQHPGLMLPFWNSLKSGLHKVPRTNSIFSTLLKWTNPLEHPFLKHFYTLLKSETDLLILSWFCQGNLPLSVFLITTINQ